MSQIPNPTTAQGPPLDDELNIAYEQWPEEYKAPILADDIVRLRAVGEENVETDEQIRMDGAVELDERLIPGPAGAPDVSVLVLRPADRRPAPACIVHLHGGGWYMGGNRDGLSEFAPWVAEFGIVVVSVEYRLAPEHPHPAPIDDCYAALVWTAEHMRELGCDTHKLLVAGASSGGNLSAGLALMARDRGGPTIFRQLLLCPGLDDRCDTVSMGESEVFYVTVKTAWTALLGDARGTEEASPYAAPARASDLAGLPSAFIEVGSADGLRDECLTYASRLSQAGVLVDLHMWAGGFHGFTVIADAHVSRSALATRREYLRRSLGV